MVTELLPRLPVPIPASTSPAVSGGQSPSSTEVATPAINTDAQQKAHSSTQQILAFLRTVRVPFLTSDSSTTNDATTPNDKAPIRIHTFEWSPLALGWYESLLYSFIFAAELSVSKGTAGVWNSTSVKLFRVQETTGMGGVTVGLGNVSLRNPRGAVDAVGGAIVDRVGRMSTGLGLGLRGATTPTGNGPGTGSRQGSIRDV